MVAMRKAGYHGKNMRVNVGLWEKQQHLISFMENELRVKRILRLRRSEGSVPSSAGKYEVLRQPKHLWRVMLVQGNSRKPVTGPGRQMPVSLNTPSYWVC